MRKFGLGVFVALMLAAGISYIDGAGNQDVLLQQMRDRAEIEDLMWRYARAVDTNDADEYAAVYAPDGQFGTGASATKGRDALRNMIADARARATANEAKGIRRPPIYHIQSNITLHFVDKDHARLDSYFLTVSGATGQDTPLRVLVVGRSIDQLVRLNGRWFIQTRNMDAQD